MQAHGTTFSFLTTIAFVMGLVGTDFARAAEPAVDRPNIIVILTDDQGYQDLGCFGSPNIKTPHLDQMASEGVRLTSFYAQPVCGVSRVQRAREVLGDIDQTGSGAHLFDEGPRKLQVPIKKQARRAKRPARNHSFLAFGQQTYLVDGNGKKTWTYPHSTRDGYLLADGRKILTLSKGKRYPGGAVVQIAADGTETLIWKGTQSEVNAVHPTEEGTFVITEAGEHPRLVEVDLKGTILVEFPLQCQKKNHHLQTRMARKLDDGTYLVPHLLDFAVFNYDADGKVIRKLDTTVAGDPDHKIHTWPFTAIRHGAGHTLVCCTNGNRVVDFDADGKIDWQLTNADLPGPWLQDPCGGQVLPNGNIVVACYAGGRKDPQAPKLFEVTRDKKVVWTYRDGQKVGIHHFQILDTNGQAIVGTPLK